MTTPSVCIGSKLDIQIEEQAVLACDPSGLAQFRLRLILMSVEEFFGSAW